MSPKGYEGYWKDGCEVLCNHGMPTLALTTNSVFHINSMMLDDIGGLTPASTQETGAKGSAMEKAFTSGQMYVVRTVNTELTLCTGK